MFNWLGEFKEASNETKLFTITAIFLGVVVVACSLFAFLRLDYVRSYDTAPKMEAVK
jgi:hypothetical protein